MKTKTDYLNFSIFYQICFLTFSDFSPLSLVTECRQQKFHGGQTWILRCEIYICGRKLGSYFCFGRWKPCFQCAKKLKFIDPNQHPNIHQNTIVSLPDSQMAIAPSTNYLKYSKVWEKNPSRQENCKTKIIAQGIFLQIKKDSTYLQVLWFLKGHQKIIKHMSNRCQI